MLVASDFYRLERMKYFEARLRFSDSARRDEWPEDFTISVELHRVIVAIYSGDYGRRHKVADDLVKVFRAKNILLQFEEL